MSNPSLSYRDVEDLLDERGLTVSNESIGIVTFAVLVNSARRSPAASLNMALSRNFGLAVPLAVR
jgi:hypothetical protein